MSSRIIRGLIVENPTAYISTFRNGYELFSGLNSIIDSLFFDSYSLIGFIDPDYLYIDSAGYDLIGPHNNPSNFEMIVSMLWQAQLPCFETRKSPLDQPGSTAFLKRCQWKGKPIDCAAIFRRSITDQGICCSFNRESADNIFSKSTYSTLVNNLQESDKNASLENTSLPEWYTTNGEPKSTPGTNMGLALMLDGHTNFLGSFSVGSDYQGYSLFIGEASDFPLMNLKSVPVIPGHSNSISISGKLNFYIYQSYYGFNVLNKII